MPSFLEIQQQSGGVVPAGMAWAEEFGDSVAEYESARTDCALFDLSHRAQLELDGNDRVRFLHNFCTNDVSKLKPAEGCEAFIPNIKGHVLAHVYVFCCQSSLWVDSIAGAEQGLRAHFERYIINDDVRIAARTDEWGELLVSGPQAAGRVARIIPEAAQLPPFGHLAARLNDASIVVRRVDYLLTDGFLVLVPRDKLGDVWLALISSGVKPAGAIAFHVARIEAGMPLFGADATEDNLVHEVGRTKRCVSFTKGCYLGQEPIARLDAMGHVNRELRGLRLDDGPAPEPGAIVTEANSDQEVGRVTSSAWLGEGHRPVALAYVGRRYLAPETRVRVATPEGAVVANVFWPVE